MISRKEFIIGLIIMFIALFFVDSIMVKDMNDTMAMLKRPVVHDTVYVVVDKHKKDTISMPLDRAECILKCQKDNVSKSLVDFCIKDKCK